MTYDLIQEQVLGSAAASVTFSNIPGTFKDLVLEVIASPTGTLTDIGIRYNNDGGNNYSRTFLVGDGSTASSGRGINMDAAWVAGYFPAVSTAISTTHIFSYASQNVFKTALSRRNNPSDSTVAFVSLWRNTAAITQVTLVTSANSIAAGSTFRLWGVV